LSTIAERNKQATNFFWRWLIGSSAASMIGNVAHAMFNTDTGNVAVAALAALVPPAVLLAATHGLAVMVRSQIVGRWFTVALALMTGLGLCALVLSFHALYELAVLQGGMPASIAWLWPLAIDLSVAFSTLALLALTTGKKARREAAVANRAPRKRVASSRPRAKAKAPAKLEAAA
jgi:hypothetical protein